MLSPDPSAYKQMQFPRGRFALPGWSVLAVDGADSAAFLQAQTMNDVRALQPRQWQWNGWLNPKGRLHALFALLRTGEATFVLVVPDLPAAELGAALQRYVFRSKVRVDAGAGWHVLGEFATADAPGDANVDANVDANAEPRVDADKALLGNDGTWTLDMAGGRRMHLSRESIAAMPADAGPPSTGAGAWMEHDLRYGLPRLPASQREKWTPQMLSLQRLHAYSLSKGCYPGQEIVARTHYLGQAKRSLHLVTGEALAPGADVRGQDEQSLGSIVCADAQGRLALGVLGDFDHAATLQSGGHPAWPVRLDEGLQRPL